MNKKAKIPVHRMDDWFSGVYIKPFGAIKKSHSTYEISQPHRHDFYYCVLIDKGKMEIEVDFEKIELTDRSLFLSYPGQIHRIISARTDSGWFLAFDPAMLESPIKTILDQCLSEIIQLPLSPAQSTELSSFAHHMFRIYSDPTNIFRQTITQALVTAFVYQVAAAYLSVERVSLNKHPARSIEITKTFRQILRRNFKSMKKPSEFAAEMNMTVSHLNDTVKSVTGFPVTFYVQQEVMREAQRLLYYSDLSVNEIADSLGFEDPQYFNRLFSKVIGTSPGSFRKKMKHRFTFSSDPCPHSVQQIFPFMQPLGFSLVIERLQSIYAAKLP